MTTNYFQTQTRPNGETFISMADDCPEWVADVVRDCHDGELPNDWRYETIATIFDYLTEYGADEDEQYDCRSGLVDVYNANLLAWYADNLNRMSYADEALGQGLDLDNLAELLMAGQGYAIECMISTVADAVREHAESVS